MKLTEEGIQNSEQWLAKGYSIPQYDREILRNATKKAPFWIHFGAGNIFRAFQARVVEELLEQGVLDRGLIVVEGYDYEIIDQIYRPHDDLSIAVTLKADGSMEKKVVGSVVESLCLDCERTEEFNRLKEIMANPSLSMVSFTITEKGYSYKNAQGEILPRIANDMKQGPKHPESYMGKVAALLYERFVKGAAPIAMVSMDNCSHNGDKLKEVIVAFAKAWQDNGFVKGDFLGYVTSKDKVSYPWTMIDKITPRPDKKVEEMILTDQVEDVAPIITTKNTYIAPFVNAEECEYLVIEDDFPNKREALEKGGFIFTDRETVEKVERMKVCTCLNPLHTALAVFGCLLGYDLIANEMKDEDLVSLVNEIGYVEGLPVVVDPHIISPQKFIDEVVTKRIPNPFLPDTPQRIATDTSQKLAIRYGETIKAYAASKDKEVINLTKIPLVFAGWLRYLMGVDDMGKQFALSSDPMLEELTAIMRPIQLGSMEHVENISKILSNKTIFGVDLYEVGLGKLVEEYFREMNVGVGAVRKTLKAKLK